MYNPKDVVRLIRNHDNSALEVGSLATVVRMGGQRCPENKGYILLEMPEDEGWPCAESSTGKAWVFLTSCVIPSCPRFMITFKEA